MLTLVGDIPIRFCGPPYTPERFCDLNLVRSIPLYLHDQFRGLIGASRSDMWRSVQSRPNPRGRFGWG